MPNHCCNTLFLNVNSLPVITKNYIKKDDHNQYFFDFGSVEFIGEVIDERGERSDRWGTPSFGYDLFIGETTIDFLTAWVPPLPIIKKLAVLHKDYVFRLEYYEVSMAFRGVYTAKWKNDEVQVEDKNWNMTNKDFRELGFIEPLDTE